MISKRLGEVWPIELGPPRKRCLQCVGSDLYFDKRIFSSLVATVSLGIAAAASLIPGIPSPFGPFALVSGVACASYSCHNLACAITASIAIRRLHRALHFNKRGCTRNAPFCF